MIAVIGGDDSWRGRASAAGRPSVALLCALLCALLGGSLLESAPALAASGRQHAFSFSFGEKGAGEGQLAGPSGVAVDDATGEVYVADLKNQRVEQFAPVVKEGQLVGERYVRAISEVHPSAIAVDNSTSESDPSRGDVYVVAENRTIYKLSPEGAPIGTLKRFSIEGSETKFATIEGVAVDTSGTLFVYQADGVVDTFSDAMSNEVESRITVEAGHTAESGLALDSNDNLYVGLEGAGGLPVVGKLERATGKLLLAQLDGEHTTAVAVNPVDDEEATDVDELNDVYVDNTTGTGREEETTVAEFDEEADLIQRFSAPGLKEGDAIAVDGETGAVYVADKSSATVDVFELELPGPPTVEDVAATSAAMPSPDARRLVAQVNPTGADTHYHFEYGTSSCAAVPSPCTSVPSSPADAGAGAGQMVSVELTGLPADTYHFRIVAENAVGSVHSAEQTFTVVTLLSGLPDGRAWEMVSPPYNAGAEAEAITDEGGEIQAAEDGRAITFVANGPMPANETPEGVRSPEPSQELSTSGPDGWLTKDIATPNSVGSGISLEHPVEYQYFSRNLALGLVEPPPGDQDASEYAQPPLSPPLTEVEKEKGQQKTISLRDDQPIESEANGETAEEREEEAQNYDKAKEEGEAMKPANVGFLPLVTDANPPGGIRSFGGGNEEGVAFIGATPNLSHVVLASYSAAPGLYEWGGPEMHGQLSKPLREVSVLEGKLLGPAQAQLGGVEGVNTRNAISKEGSLVFWTEKATVGYHLFVRDTVTEETLQLDTVQPGASGEGTVKPVFQTASADGSKVFFTDTQRLTPDSAVGKAEEPDLYVVELKDGRARGSALSGTLRDLTPRGENEENADIVHGGGYGGVIGASEDGSYVYFVANGALAPGATAGGCPTELGPTPAGTTCNLYVRHFDGTHWEPTKLIAALSPEDAPDWGGFASYGNLAYMTARVSPNGEYLAFMSDRSLTGYDNEDQSSKAPGERLDEEVYLYQASSGRVECASCNPTGARPVGVFDAGSVGAEAGNAEGIGLVVDRPKLWGIERAGIDHWLAASVPGWTSLTGKRAVYQSRYLSDEGRLFFNGADALVPMAKPTRREKVGGVEQQVGVENVYEYEPGGQGGCRGEAGCVGLISSGTSEHESAFLDASANGNDVFFLTSSVLVPQDIEGNFAVYDAHVCEASSPCPEPSSTTVEHCEGEACQGSSSPPPAFATPASATFSGSGNIVLPKQAVLNEKKVVPPPKLTRAQKLARALKACRKDKKKSKRIACEKQARKQYGPITKKPTAKKGSPR